MQATDRSNESSVRRSQPRRMQRAVKEGGDNVSEEMKKMINETVENLKHLDKESLLIMKSNSEILKARDALDEKPEREPCQV